MCFTAIRLIRHPNKPNGPVGRAKIKHLLIVENREGAINFKEVVLNIRDVSTAVMCIT